MKIDRSYALQIILMRAKKDIKHNNRIYNSYKREIEELDLEPKEYEKAVRELSKVLKV